MELKPCNGAGKAFLLVPEQQQGTEWSYQDSVDTPPPSLVSGVELFGANSTKMTVIARSIVKRLDVLGHVC